MGKKGRSWAQAAFITAYDKAAWKNTSVYI